MTSHDSHTSNETQDVGDTTRLADDLTATTPIALPADETPTIALGQRDDAAADQRNAAAGYAREAAHNGYPGGGAPRTGNPYAAYPGWNRNAPASATPVPSPRIVEDPKPKACTGTVVWGIIVTVAAVLMAVPLAIGNITIDSMFWLQAATAAALALGVVLIVGAIISATRGNASRNRTGKPADGRNATPNSATPHGATPHAV